MEEKRAPNEAEGRRTVPFHRPSIGDREIAAVSEVLQSGWITTGERTAEFERRFAEYLGASHAVAVNSCTAALHIALAAQGIGPGDEVITTPYTFVATVETIVYLGATPVLVDIDPATRNMDPAMIERSMTPRTRAIVPVHVAGLPCDLDPILDLARSRGVSVVEDAAHSLPSSYHGRAIGTISEATAFSFYATKNLTTGEGGMLTTEDPDLAARWRRMSLHGITSDGWKRYRLGGRWFYEVVDLGYKYNLTDIASALGVVQLERLDEFDRRRQSLARFYRERLAGLPALTLPSAPEDSRHSWHLFIVAFHADVAGFDREEFIARLSAQGVSTSVHFIPVHLHPYYGKRLGYERGDFPRAEAAFECAVSLPLYPAMTDEDAEYVVRAVDRALQGRPS